MKHHDMHYLQTNRLLLRSCHVVCSHEMGTPGSSHHCSGESRTCIESQHSLMSNSKWPVASKIQLYLIRLAWTVQRFKKMLYERARNHVQLYNMSPRRFCEMTRSGHHIMVRRIKADVLKYDERSSLKIERYSLKKATHMAGWEWNT